MTIQNPEAVPIRLFSAGVGAVSGSGEAGWVDGTIASLAASAAATVRFDLGEDWILFPFIRLHISWVAPSTGTNNLQVYSGDTLGALTRRIGFIDTDSISTVYATLSSANGPQTLDLRPMGRYLTITATNADAVNAVGATARVDLAQYPH